MSYGKSKSKRSRDSRTDVPVKVPVSRKKRRKEAFAVADWEFRAFEMEDARDNGEDYAQHCCQSEDAFDGNFIPKFMKKHEIAKRQFSTGLRFVSPYVTECLLEEGECMLIVKHMSASGCSRKAGTCWCNAYDDSGKLITSRQRGKKWSRLTDEKLSRLSAAAAASVPRQGTATSRPMTSYILPRTTGGLPVRLPIRAPLSSSAVFKGSFPHPLSGNQFASVESHVAAKSASLLGLRRKTAVNGSLATVSLTGLRTTDGKPPVKRRRSRWGAKS